MIQTPIEVPLLDRSKEELVAIIGRLKENLSWYVEERNRLIAESQAPQRLLERLRDGLSRMREGDRSGPSAQHMLEWVEQCIPAELGDGEPSPKVGGVYTGLRGGCTADPSGLHECGVEENHKLCVCWSCGKSWPNPEWHGAAQEVSPIGSVYEIRPRPDDPSCHICGAQMAVKEWKCLSCKATSGAQEVSPSPSPDAFQEAWAKYNKAGLSTGWERVGFVGGFKYGFDAGRKSAEGDTRELKAALKQCHQALWYAKFDIPDMIDAKRAALKEIKRLLGEDSQP